MHTAPECNWKIYNFEYAKTIYNIRMQRSGKDHRFIFAAARNAGLQGIRQLRRKQQDFAIETTLATRTLLKTVKRAQAAGYTVTLLYFWLNSPEMAIERVRARVEAGGHNIPEETIRRRYATGIYYFFNLYSPICERWILTDNSQIPFRVIAEGTKDEVINIRDEETFAKIKAIADDKQKIEEENGIVLSL